MLNATNTMICSFNLFYSKIQTSTFLFFRWIICTLFMINVFIHNSVDIFRLSQFLYNISVIFQQVSFNLLLLSNRQLRDIWFLSNYSCLFLLKKLGLYATWFFISSIIKLTMRVHFFINNHFFKTLIIKLWIRLISKIFTLRKTSSTSFEVIINNWLLSFKLHILRRIFTFLICLFILHDNLIR